MFFSPQIFIVTAGLALAVLVLSVISLAVTVAVPAVFRVTLKDLVPPAKAAFEGSTAFASLEVSLTVSAIVLTTFQFESTAFTVTLNAVPAVWASGVPVLPLVVPGAALSPGTSNCSFTNPAVFTGMDELVLAALVPSVASVAVIVPLGVVFKETLKLLVPLIKTAL